MTGKVLLKKLLKRYVACQEAVIWCEPFESPGTAWLASQNPEYMLWALDHLGVKNDRAYRLFACWCVRNTPLSDGRKVWDLLADERSRTAVEVAERFVDGQATEEEMAAAWDAASSAASAAASAAAWDAARAAAGAAARAASWAAACAAARAAASAAARAAQADALREFFGNPFADEKQLMTLVQQRTESKP